MYILSDDGYLYQLDRRSGKPRWKFDTHGAGVARDLPSATSATYDYQTSAATVADGIVYIGSADKKLYAIDARSGKERWHFDTQGSVRSTPAVAGGRVFFGSYDHFVYALDASSGALVWKHDTLEPVVSAPLVADGAVYIGSRSSDLFAFDAATGSGALEIFLLVVVGRLFGAIARSARCTSAHRTTSRCSRSMRPAAGKDGASARDGSPWSTPAVTDQRVYIGVVGVTPYFIDHHGGVFRARSRQRQSRCGVIPMSPIDGATDYGVASSPAVDHGLVFFGGLDGNFYAFRAD